jgi:hypothetical protein
MASAAAPSENVLIRRESIMVSVSYLICLCQQTLFTL